MLADSKFVDLINIGIITQRGAFKQLKLKLINKVTRAKRGVLVLRELKSKPHRIMAISSYGENHILNLTTSSDRHIEINTSEFPLGNRYSNGSFVLDPMTDGTPVTLSLGRPLADGRDKTEELF